MSIFTYLQSEHIRRFDSYKVNKQEHENIFYILQYSSRNTAGFVKCEHFNTTNNRRWLLTLSYFCMLQCYLNGDWLKSIQPSIHFLALIQFPDIAVKRQGKPLTGGQSLTGSSQRGGQLFTLAPTINLESPVNLASMSLDCWGKLDYLERTHELKVIGDSCLTSSYTWIILTLLLTHSYFLYLQIQWSQ